MHPAFWAKSGSRGKIHERYRHGRMASSWSHRHTVLSPILATRPHSRACRVRSATLQRDRGTSRVQGSSHARALICTTSSGGKTPGAARPWTLFKACDALFKEPLSPHADDFTAGIESGCNLIVSQSLGRQKNDLGTDDLKIRQRILGCTPRQLPG